MKERFEKLKLVLHGNVSKMEQQLLYLLHMTGREKLTANHVPCSTFWGHFSPCRGRHDFGERSYTLTLTQYVMVKTYLGWKHVKGVWNRHATMDNTSWTSKTGTSVMRPLTTCFGYAWPWHSYPLNWLTSLSTDPNKQD